MFDPYEMKVQQLKNEKQGEKNLEKIRKSIDSNLKKIQPSDFSISEQNQHVYGWWKKLAKSHKPDIHYSFVNDLPVGLVSNFMVEKGIVPHTTEALRLFKQDIRECETLGSQYKRMNYEDFMNIFNKRMFVNALMCVIQKIQKTGGTSKSGDPDEIPLALKINQFERQFIMKNLDPEDEMHTAGQKVLNALHTMK